MTDDQLLQRIVSDPKVMTGKPVIRGTRLTVDFILNLLAHGASEEDTVRSYRQAYQQGTTDLLLTVRYQGSDPKLSLDQIRELDRHLSATTYLRAQDVVKGGVKV